MLPGELRDQRAPLQQGILPGRWNLSKMVHICEDYLIPSAEDGSRLVCQVPGGLQEGCRAGICWAATSICYCPVSRYDLVERSDVGGDEFCCVILHNMIIESEREEPVDESEREEPYFKQGPLAAVDHQVPASWVAFLTLRQEIRDPHIHQQLQKDLLEHLWRLKGEA